MVDEIERINLTEQVRDEILNHTGPEPPATQEGRILKLVDRIAYINHDIDDAIRAGVLRFEQLPRAEIELLGPPARIGSRRSWSTCSTAPTRPATSCRRKSAARCFACGSSCSSRSTSGRRRSARSRASSG